VLEPLLIHNLLTKLEFAEMLEIAFTLSAEWAIETGSMTHALRISFIMNTSVEMLIINLLEFDTIFLIFDIMLEIASLPVAGAREITILRHILIAVG
jgi:hypothetical protein